jgi:hypothetical protein
VGGQLEQPSDVNTSSKTAGFADCAKSGEEASKSVSNHLTLLILR